MEQGIVPLKDRQNSKYHRFALSVETIMLHEKFRLVTPD
jgi:hypothetical protein